MYFNFFFYFFTWYSCNRIKNLCNKCRNWKVPVNNLEKEARLKEVLLAKSKLNSIEFLISKSLIDSVINHEELVLIKNVQKEYEKMKQEIKNLKN